jgi:putative transposase
MILLFEHPTPSWVREPGSPERASRDGVGVRPINPSAGLANQGHPRAALDANDLWIRRVGAKHPVESYGQLARRCHLGHRFRLAVAAMQILTAKLRIVTDHDLRGLYQQHAQEAVALITCSCYRRLRFLGSARRRDLFLKILEEARQKYNFVVVGYVVMPEHFHILMSEPKTGSLSLVMQVLKQRVARKCRGRRRSADQLCLWEGESPRFWQTRCYDFNVYSGKKKIQKLRYMHHNRVKRGLVTAPEEWRWSSYR